MKTYPFLFSLLTLIATSSMSPAHAQTDLDDFYRHWVSYENGSVSLEFEQTPIAFALSALHATTGFQIVMPTPPDTKVVNLKLNQQPLEPAIRSLISSIGYQNFALMYDDKGRPSRAVVLGMRPAVTEEQNAIAKAGSTVEPLSSDEQDRLQKELEHWSELNQEERGRIEDRLKQLPQSDERDQLIKLYGRQILALSK